MKRPGLAFLLVILLSILVASLAAEAQPPAKVRLIGVLSPGGSPPGSLEPFREGLRDLGYVEGRTIVIEWRFAEGKNERLPGLADELVQLKVDVIFAVNTSAALAAKKATTTIPIVIARLADPPQPQDCEGARTHDPPAAPAPGGSLDRVARDP
jgi:putative tryptophan/tyrosine transport system substrate-binding protein